MKVKFNFNIEICRLQNELRSLRCLNTFLEDYSEWNSLGLYSPSLTKFSLASALPIAAKQGWNSIAVILLLPLRAEKSHIHFQICRSHLAIRDRRDPKACESRESLAIRQAGEELGAQKHHFPQLQCPTSGWCSQACSLLSSPPGLARPVA